MVLFLAGDIGGTNTRLQLLRAAPTKVQGKEWEKGRGEVVVAEETFPSPQYKTLESVIDLFLKKYLPAGEQVYCMCLAVAGPVTDNVSAVTNLTWKIDGAALTRYYRLEGKAILINDFVGIGYGLLALEHSDLEVVYQPPPHLVLPRTAATTGVKAVIGAGTGLGECYLTHNGTNYDVWGSEGGHADFAPRNPREWAIFQHIMATTKHHDGTPLERCSIERVTSGLGLPKIYDYLLSIRGNEANPEARRKISEAKEEVGRVISEFARSGKCPLCVETLDIFCQSYGAEAGNLSIKTLPFGGLYIAGGIASKNMEVMRKNKQFVENYLDKGRMRGVLEKIPIYLITHPQVGLLGSKVMCRRMVREAQLQAQQQPLRAKL